MSMWIRALCTTTVADVTPAELCAGIAERLAGIAADYGEEDAAATVGRLRVAGEAPLAAWEISYRGDETSLGVARASKPAEVREEVGELVASLAECDEDGVDDVRELLGHVVEVVTFELSLSDCEGLGWPVAIAAAAYLAARGEGLVQADGEGWMEPAGLGVEHVLDGD
jgi:hypothetical protein